jgi:hypothetical protein
VRVALTIISSAPSKAVDSALPDSTGGSDSAAALSEALATRLQSPTRTPKENDVIWMRK